MSRLVHPWQPTRQEENARHTGHGIDPQRYLTSVLAKLPTTPPDELDQFLPDVWKKEDAAESLSAENENNLGIPSKQSRAK
ncbi:MAG TPA: transposase domain-containing protein [Thermoguttaceae bacterium]|nr:transposase domain-containing protein [Thermoguttaceae bacterium]